MIMVLLVAAAILIPSVAILHATTASTPTSTNHESENHSGSHTDQEHDNNETSDDNQPTTHVADDMNENETDD